MSMETPFALQNSEHVYKVFNRTRKMNLLSNSLKLQPGLHVLTSPVNSGKSLVVKKLLESFEAAHVPVMNII